MSGCIGSTSINFTWIFPRKSTSSVSSFSSISIYYYFSSSKSSISVWTSNYKFSSWIDMIFNIFIKIFLIARVCFLINLGINIDRISDLIFSSIGFSFIKIIMLGRQYNCYNFFRFIII